MSNRKKAQAAMEFLMTYGWAILAVLVVIAALAFFGVLDPANVVPDSCGFPSNFACTDFSVENPNTVSFKIRNDNLKNIDVTGVGVEGNGVDNPCSITSTPTDYPVSMKPGGEQLFVIPCTFSTTASKKERYILSITYRAEEYTSLKTVYGQIYSKREG